MSETTRHQVVVIGSGFGGLFGTKALRRADVDITMIAQTTHHLFQPLLYQVATGILSEGEIAPPTREILSGQRNARVLLGTVTGIDLEARTVTHDVLGRTTITPYDTLLVAAGASQSYFGNDQFAEFAPGMKSVDDALELRGRIFGAFEIAEVMASAGHDVDHLLTFVVVGAGPTGVEMAGQIAELSRRTLKRDFHAINCRQARVILVDAASQVLPPFGEKLGVKTQRELEKLGVEVQLGAMVTDVDERGLEVQDKDGSKREIRAVTKIWAAGVQASSLGRTLAEQSGAELDRAGRIGVQPDLTLPGHPEVFVVGDMISLDHLPGVAQVAIQGGQYAADTIQDRLAGKPEGKAFHYFDKGSMATISRFRAVAMVGKLRLTGTVAWLMWLGVHLVYMTGFKNRFSALGHWTVSFLGSGRSERVSTEQQVFARSAINRLHGGTTELVSTPGVYEATADLLATTRAELEERAERGGAAHRLRQARPRERVSHAGPVSHAAVTNRPSRSISRWTAVSSSAANRAASRRFAPRVACCSVLRPRGVRCTSWVRRSDSSRRRSTSPCRSRSSTICTTVAPETPSIRASSLCETAPVARSPVMVPRSRGAMPNGSRNVAVSRCLRACTWVTRKPMLARNRGGVCSCRSATAIRSIRSCSSTTSSGSRSPTSRSSSAPACCSHSVATSAPAAVRVRA